jgi:hypothetical protein
MASTSGKSIEEPNSNDFDDLVDRLLSIEDQNAKLGFSRGSTAAHQKNVVEGYSLGVVKGIESGTEIGIYLAFANTWLAFIELADSSKDAGKAKKPLKQLLALAEKCTDSNTKDESTLELKQSLQAKFKQSCAILKVDSTPLTGGTITW